MHDYISNAPDVGGERIAMGYPDECYSFMAFSDSLSALLTTGKWMITPFTQKRLAVVVDFASETQEEAEASLKNGWNGAWQFPNGNANTVRSRVDTNEQNARIERHLSLIATGDTMREFFWHVGEKLLDGHSCTDPDCRVCRTRYPRNLAMALTILGDGLRLSRIDLVSKWEPDDAIRGILAEQDIVLQWNPLAAIPEPDLEANRFYHIWDGTEKQYDDFTQRFWRPAWQGAGASTVDLRPRPARSAQLELALPDASPAWKSLDRMRFIGTYLMPEADYSSGQRADFVRQANRMALAVIGEMAKVTKDPNNITWELVPEGSLPKSLRSAEQPSDDQPNVRIYGVFAQDQVAEAFWRAWAPRLTRVLAFALAGQRPADHPATGDGDGGNILRLQRD